MEFYEVIFCIVMLIIVIYFMDSRVKKHHSHSSHVEPVTPVTIVHERPVYGGAWPHYGAWPHHSAWSHHSAWPYHRIGGHAPPHHRR